MVISLSFWKEGQHPSLCAALMLRGGDLDRRQYRFYEKIDALAHFFQDTIAMMGYGPKDKNVVLELTYNYGVTVIAIGTDDVYKTAAAIKLYGGRSCGNLVPCPHQHKDYSLAWIPMVGNRDWTVGGLCKLEHPPYD
ncbi:hypothetical protein IFM89_022707 [Coptis chinensis]|uniref:Uncharacterized protein n=1 Tax=Coptis chinensis TaxID=261450 RepID=A0A835LNP0_9MAGN|nr:hypothetical protein IFM89_022707 [Coptis chinensis]